MERGQRQNQRDSKEYYAQHFLGGDLVEREIEVAREGIERVTNDHQQFPRGAEDGGGAPFVRREAHHTVREDYPDSKRDRKIGFSTSGRERESRDFIVVGSLHRGTDKRRVGLGAAAQGEDSGSSARIKSLQEGPQKAVDGVGSVRR